MKLYNYIKRLNVKYVIIKVRCTRIPHFDLSPIARKNVMFTGRVQKVGFRLEIHEVAKRLSLTGYVANMDNDKVEMEVQGESEKILFLINHMKSLKRAKVINVSVKDKPIKSNEREFIVVK